ncbi:MAG: hypothetical protein QXR53_02960 [Candidatus Norongarragalinales archaeon]
MREATGPRFTPSELADHLSENADIRHSARQAASAMQQLNASEPPMPMVASIRQAIRKFEQEHPALFPRAGGYNAVIAELVARHAPKQTSQEEEKEKKPKRFEI